MRRLNFVFHFCVWIARRKITKNQFTSVETRRKFFFPFYFSFSSSATTAAESQFSFCSKHQHDPAINFLKKTWLIFLMYQKWNFASSLMQMTPRWTRNVSSLAAVALPIVQCLFSGLPRLRGVVHSDNLSSSMLCLKSRIICVVFSAWVCACALENNPAENLWCDSNKNDSIMGFRLSHRATETFVKLSALALRKAAQTPRLQLDRLQRPFRQRN